MFNCLSIIRLLVVHLFITEHAIYIYTHMQKELILGLPAYNVYKKVL